MMLATFNVFVIPLDVGFNPKSFQTGWFDAVNIVIDLVFFIDILISFRTTFIDPRTGAEIKKANLIAQRYLRG